MIIFGLFSPAEALEAIKAIRREEISRKRVKGALL